MAKPVRIVVHHEAGNNGFYGVNEYHHLLWNFKSSLGWYIGYQYYINKFGKVWQGRADNEEGAHIAGFNSDSLGICLEGNLNQERPTAVQLIALKNLINLKMAEHGILPDQIVGHRMLKYTNCPGKTFPESEFRNLFQPDRGYFVKLLEVLKEKLLIMKRQLGGTVKEKDFDNHI